MAYLVRNLLLVTVGAFLGAVAAGWALPYALALTILFLAAILVTAKLLGLRPVLERQAEAGSVMTATNHKHH